MQSIDEILSLIERPARYLGNEINATQKDISKAKLKIALAFPDLYEIGTSHFGIQILYNIINSRDDSIAERVYAPAKDLEKILRTKNKKFFSLESKTELNKFDICGFSLLYELNYTNILTILDLAGIPFLAKNRLESHPIIIAGGPCTVNPEPVCEFFDALVIGDGEYVINEMIDSWIKWDKKFKKELLELWSKIKGVYIPSFFEVYYDGFQQKLIPKIPDYTHITKTIVSDLNKTPFLKKIIVPFGKPVHDRLNLEIARGCTRGCRFCQAGMIYRPVRERSIENILQLMEHGLISTGYKEISLMSLSSGDYSLLLELMLEIMSRCEKRHVAVSFPSLRAGTITPEIMSLIKKVRKTGFTIAPEAGSQRLRNIINKNITEDDILNTIQEAFQAGWKLMKLYFMIGLPFETDNDLEAIVDLINKIKKSFKGNQINAGVSTFIPKSHTPFQWSSQISLSESQEKINYLKKNLTMGKVKLKWQNPKLSYLEGIWANGDRRLSGLLIKAYESGCRFDGWDDSFNFSIWDDLIKNYNVDLNKFLQTKDLNYQFPWDHVDCGICKSFLINEFKNAQNALTLTDCRTEKCNNCGVCDFKTIKPVVNDKNSLNIIQTEKDNKTNTIQKQESINEFKKIKCFFQKRDLARFFGHLEMVNIFIRAFNRAKISLKYSQGFHPMPKISFSDPIPLGMQSNNEWFIATIVNNYSNKEIFEKLNKELPKGLVIFKCSDAVNLKNQKKILKNIYEICLASETFDESKLNKFQNIDELYVSKTNKKGKTYNIDLKKIIKELELINQSTLKITVVNENGNKVKIIKIIQAIFDNISEVELLKSNILKCY